MPRFSIIVALLVGLLWAGNSFAATVESSFSWGQVKMTQAQVQEQEYHRVAKIAGPEWEAILSVEIEGDVILMWYTDLTMFGVGHVGSELTVSGTKAGGWRGRGKQPQMAVRDNGTVFRGHALYDPFVIWNFKNQVVAGADVKIQYDADQVTISIDDRYKPEGFFLEANTTVPGLIKVATASAEGTKEDVFMFFQVIVTTPADAPLGSRVSFTAEIVFYDELGENIGSQWSTYRFLVREW